MKFTQKPVRFVARSSVAVLAALALAGCAADLPTAICEDWDFDCYIEHTALTRDVIRAHIAYWSNANIIAKILIVFLGIVATVMIALQGDQNKVWTRPIGLVATTLVTGITSALVSLHVPENVDKLVDIYGNMTINVNDFAYETEKIRLGRSRQELQAAFKTDKQFRDAANELTKKYADAHGKLKVEMLKLSGSTGKLNITSTPAPSGAVPSQSK